MKAQKHTRLTAEQQKAMARRFAKAYGVDLSANLTAHKARAERMAMDY